MAGDTTVVMEWFHTTPCGSCGKDIRIGKDDSRGKVRYAASGPVRATCGACGHEDQYPPTAIDAKASVPGR